MVLNKKHTDHCPIILKDGNVDFGPKPTKVFDEWLNYKEAPEIIKAAWMKEVKSSNPDCTFRDKMKNVKTELRKWYSTSPGKLKAEIKELSEVVDDWEIRAESEDLSEEQLKEWMDSRDLLHKKENTQLEMLKQKARVKWDLEGDENTKFFHTVIRRRQQKNNIHGVNIAGVWSTNPDDIKAEALSHFSSLFEKPNTEGLEMNDWDGPRLESNMVEKLEARFNEKEILQAIKSCGRNKASGPDGFNILFFTKYWDIIKEDLVKALNWFWENERI
ncbi:uncharacterized protein [Rutidosis leptorrhynchoides]|uniref:uncharacterized protein n=1 Tax=Rutidosis leptorrhynchoides TaxID=125765 RepID=UPI003A996C01